MPPRKLAAMRPMLRWSLVAAASASAWALWWPREEAPPAVVSARDPGQPRTGGQIPPLSSAPSLPETLSRPDWPVADTDFDPFVGVVPPPPPPPKPPPPPPAAIALPAPPPAPPPMQARFLGRMDDPTGKQRVYLTQGEQIVEASVGTRLDNGYVVQSIEPEAIKLHYAPLNTLAVIAIPAAAETTKR